MTIDAFIKSLASYEGALTFNPWKDTDLRYEVEKCAIHKERAASRLPFPPRWEGKAFSDR